MSEEQPPRADGESSVELLSRVRQGDREALDRLLHRYVPALRRWATGRLPRWARDMAETEDLVQDTVLKSLRDEDRQAIVGRVEMGYSYQELAVMFGKPSADAARVSVSRALVRLADVLRQTR
jgi:DNA-directed RNA polymerase specialized sigma24 family protein